MTALIRRFVAKTKAVPSRRRPRADGAEDTLRLLEQLFAAYWPVIRTERTTDAAGEVALLTRVPGLRNWIFRPAPALVTFARSDELATTEQPVPRDEFEAFPNIAAIGAVTRMNGRHRAGTSTSAIG